jgi:hypothetical protein
MADSKPCHFLHNSRRECGFCSAIENVAGIVNLGKPEKQELVNFMNRTASGYQVRVEGLWIG